MPAFVGPGAPKKSSRKILRSRPTSKGTLVEADMYERGALGQYPPGWTCYVAERREVSPDSDYVESLLRGPRL